MSQDLQNFVKFQKFQLENLVDFEKCSKTLIFLQKSEPIQLKTSNILPKFYQKLATTLRVRKTAALLPRPAPRGPASRARARPPGDPRRAQTPGELCASIRSSKVFRTGTYGKRIGCSSAREQRNLLASQVKERQVSQEIGSRLLHAVNCAFSISLAKYASFRSLQRYDLPVRNRM